MGILDDIMSATGIGGATQAVNPGGVTQQQHCSALSMILDYVNSPQVGGISGLQGGGGLSGAGGTADRAD